MKRSEPHLRSFIAAGILVALTLAAFRPVIHYAFLSGNWDDAGYVTENPMVQAGLTRQGLVWAFTTTSQYNWHPLTWLSHMLDAQLFGMDARGHHLSSLMIHLAGALLLLWVLKGLTGSLWPSAFAAALFALHPLHVESVAWVAERKDVLSGFLWLLTIAAYLGYLRRPRRRTFLLVVLVFALGLMAKPMVVTLPIVLLLLDFWPLGRLLPPVSSPAGAGARPWLTRAGTLVAEKAPLLLLSLASSVVTWQIQARDSVVRPLDVFPLPLRLSNAAVTYLLYIRDLVRPTDLAFFYPYPMDGLSFALVGSAVLVLIAMTALVIWQRSRRPYLLMGWAWYLVALVPVIGLVQVGSQTRADRYTYLPLIGLFIAAAWAMAEIFARRPVWRAPLAAAGTCVVLVCAALTYRQVGYWHDTDGLARRAVAVTTGNWVALTKLGFLHLERGEREEGLRYYREAAATIPARAERHFRQGARLAGQGLSREAAEQYLLAAKIYPPFSQADYQLGMLYSRQGDLEKAADYLLDAIAYRPDFVEAHFQRGVIRAGQGFWEEAVTHFFAVLQARPDYPEAHYNLAVVLEGLGRTEEAREHYRLAQ